MIRFSHFRPDLAVASSLCWVLVTDQKPSSLVWPGMMTLICACSIVWEIHLIPSGLQGRSAFSGRTTAQVGQTLVCQPLNAQLP